MAIAEELKIIIRAEVAQATAAFENLQRQTATASQSMQNAGRTLSRTLTPAILGAAAASIAFAVNVEQQEVALGVLLGSQEAANDLMQEFIDLSSSTPLQLDGLVAGGQRLLAFGTEAEDVVETMRMLGDAAMGNQDTLNRLVDAYGRVQTKGRASLEELNRFTEAGVPIMEALGEVTGVTGEALFDLVSSGQVGFAEVEQALTSLTTGTGQFAGMMEEMSQTLGGRLTTLRDNIGQLGMELIDVLMPAINGVVDGVSNLVTWFRELSDSQQNMTLMLLAIAAAAGPAISMIASLSSGLTALGVSSTAAVGPIGLVIAGVMSLVALGQTEMRQLENQVRALRDGFDELSGVFRQYDRTRIIAMFEGGDRAGTDLMETVRAVAEEFGVSTVRAYEYARAIGYTLPVTGEAASVIDDLSDGMQTLIASIGEIPPITLDVGLDGNGLGEIADYIAGMKILSEQEEITERSLIGLKDEFKEIAAELTETLIPAVDSTRAAFELMALKSMTAIESVKGATESLTISNEEMFKNINEQIKAGVVQTMSSGFLDLASALGASTAGVGSAKDALADYLETILRAIPKLLFNAGVMVLSSPAGITPQGLAIGLSLIAASGLGALIIGAVDAKNSDPSLDNLSSISPITPSSFNSGGSNVINNNYSVIVEGTVISADELDAHIAAIALGAQ